MIHFQYGRAVPVAAPIERRTLIAQELIAPAPGPRVAEPKCRQQVKLRRFRAAICRSDANADILGRDLGIFDEEVEVTIIVEYARVHQLEFGIRSGPSTVLPHQPRVRKLCLRVFVEELHVRVRGSAVQEKIIFLHVLAMIAFVS